MTTATKKKTAIKRVTSKVPGRPASEVLEELLGTLTLGKLINAIREGEEWSLTEMGRQLGVSRTHVHDVENGRRVVSPERAAQWAKVLGYSEAQFVSLALQAELDKAGLRFRVEVKAS